MNVQEIFKDPVDDGTCPLYDIILYLFTKLDCLADEIIAILPSESEDNTHVTDKNSLITNEKTGKSIWFCFN